MSVDSIIAAMDAVALKKESLHKAYLDLESHSSAVVNFKIEWKELQDHFDKLEELMKKRSEELGIEVKTEGTKAGVAPASIPVEAKKDTEKAPAEAKKAAENTPKKAAESNPKKAAENTPKNGEKSQPRPEFKSLCEKMDAEGLKKFLVNNRKKLGKMRSEGAGALRCAPKPAELVLKVLEGFFSKRRLSDKESKLFMQRRRAALWLLETLPAVMKAEEVPAEDKKAAKKMANSWKPRIKLEERPNYNNPVANAFLQLLNVYGLASEFKDDFIVDLVAAVSRRKKTPGMSRSIGLTDRIQDIVKKLIKSGKKIEAVNAVYAFGLVEKFPPVPLLNEYLKDAKKISQETAKSGKYSMVDQNEAATKEIAAIEAVIKCIEDNELESQMPTETLEKRIYEIEKAKADRKRTADAVMSQAKRPRINNSGGAGASTAAFSTSNAADRSILCPADRLQYPGLVPGITAFNLPVHGLYDRSSQGILGSHYDIGSRSEVSLSRSHLLPSDNLMYGAGSFGASLYGATYPSSYLR